MKVYFLVRHRRKGDEHAVTESIARPDPKEARADAEARARELRQRDDIHEVEIEERHRERR